MKPNIFYILFVFSIIIPSYLCITLLPNHPDAKPLHLPSPIIPHIGPKNWKINVTGPITLDRYSDLNGKILIFDLDGWETQDQCVTKFNGSGSIGIITLLRVNSKISPPGLGKYVNEGKDVTWSEIPFFEITRGQLDEIIAYMELSEDGVTYGNLVHDDENKWIYWMEGAPIIIFIVILGVFHGFIILYTVGRLTIYWLYVGFVLNICQVVHLIQLAANLLRFIYFTLDPFGVAFVLTYFESQMLLTISFPATILTMLLVTFYWHELIHKVDAKVNKFLTKMKIPFIISFIIMFVAELISSIFRGLQSGFQIMTYVTGLLYAVAVLLTLGFYFLTQYKLRKTYKEFSSLNTQVNKNTRSIKKVSRYYLICAVLMIIWFILLLMGGVSPLLFTPGGFVILWLIGYFTLGMISLIQVMTFSLPDIWKTDFNQHTTAETSYGTNTKSG